MSTGARTRPAGRVAGRRGWRNFQRGGSCRRAVLMLGLVGAGLTLGAGAARAQEPGLKLGPSLLRADGETTAGVRLTYRWDNLEVNRSKRLPWTRSAGVTANLPATWDPDRNPESLRVELRGGAFLSLFNPPSPPANPVPGERYGSWNYGYLSASARVSVEAPQRLDRADLLAGVVLIYEHDQYQSLWFLPELRLAADRGLCAGCDLPQGVDRDRDFTRLEGEADWFIPLDRVWMPDPLRPLWLRTGLRGFLTRGMGTALGAQRPDEGLERRVELAYRLDGSRWVHEVYLNWSDGHVPVFREDRQAWGGGLTFFF
jgi:hypothetical protein